MSENTPSKAAQLAKELQAEKQRLEKELEELHTDYDNVKPTTPTGTWDWVVKWVAVVFAVIGVFTMSAGFQIEGQIMYVLSGIAWIYVGMMWGDRAIMIGMSITTTSVLLTLVQHFVK
jgi:hypothetical protein